MHSFWKKEEENLEENLQNPIRLGSEALLATKTSSASNPSADFKIGCSPGAILGGHTSSQPSQTPKVAQENAAWSCHGSK